MVDYYHAPMQVYDYDWGLRDDFMGSVSLQLDSLQPGEATDLVLTLGEAGEFFVLGLIVGGCINVLMY